MFGIFSILLHFFDILICTFCFYPRLGELLRKRKNLLAFQLLFILWLFFSYSVPSSIFLISPCPLWSLHALSDLSMPLSPVIWNFSSFNLTPLPVFVYCPQFQYFLGLLLFLLFWISSLFCICLLYLFDIKYFLFCPRLIWRISLLTGTQSEEEDDAI